MKQKMQILQEMPEISNSCDEKQKSVSQYAIHHIRRDLILDLSQILYFKIQLLC